MKAHHDTPESLKHAGRAHRDMAGLSDVFLYARLQEEPPAALCRSASPSGAERTQLSDGLSNGGAPSSESLVSGRLRSDATEVSEGSLSSAEARLSDTDEDGEEGDEDLTPEVQQAYRIFQSFLLEKHKALTAPFWRPVGPREAGGAEMNFKRIDNKFVSRDYESITEFVADFRLMLENCYRFHGVDHWKSKQAQKLETILEQKLTLLSRALREKTTLAVTSRGRFGAEDEKGPVGTSTRRRSVPRSLAAITVGGCESVMVQALRLEEQQRAKEEKRQRELEKKEAEETSAKEVEEWELGLLSLAEPWSISTVWELPAIGHFLCLAQTALNLPEIVFYELERCLLMPRCSSFLAKVMTSLLCQPHRRAALHRRPTLPYHRWEEELKQKVLGWYQEVGRAEDQVARAEQLGLCHRFFWTLGETSPLEMAAFHLLPFNQRVWLLKGLCDNVYETQKDVQDAVLGQPIHECRESILGYDSQENAYIHFPHFCGADLRIYCQSPYTAVGFPLPPFHVKKLKREVATPGDSSAESQDKRGEHLKVKEENGGSTSRDFYPWSMGASSEEREPDPKGLFPCEDEEPERIEEFLKVEQRVKLKEQEDRKEMAEGNSDCEYCLKVGENCYKGKSPANSLKTSFQFLPVATQKDVPPRQDRGPCPKCSMKSEAKLEHCSFFCFNTQADRADSMFPLRAGRSWDEAGQMRCKKKKRKKKKERALGLKAGTGKLGLKKVRQARTSKSTLNKSAAAEGKDKKKKRKLGAKFDSKKTGEKGMEPPQLPVEPTFRLICTNLDELRDLISKTEDELDELEGAKKRCERWYLQKKSVKELHITLIRLLNELLPWEPKLLKAFQRNRARLKKECDDFRKHPEYDLDIRDECKVIEGDGGSSTKAFSSAEIRRESEDEDKMERMVKRDSSEEHESLPGNESLGQRICGSEDLIARRESGPLTRSSKRDGLDEDFSPSKRAKLVDEPEPQLDVTSGDQITPESASAIKAPLSTLQRHGKPIQALLAKSVGNKVTLMSHSQAAVMPNKTESAAVPPAKPAATSCQMVPQSTPVTVQTQAPTTSPKSPIQAVCNLPNDLSVVGTGGATVKLSVQPIAQQKEGDGLMPQVIILPSHLLVQRPEETRAHQLPTVTSLPAPKTPMILSSNPVADNKIPVQQVAPLKDTSTEQTTSPGVSPRLQKIPGKDLPIPKKTTEPCLTLNTTPACPNKCDVRQELKTVCIRDSQSILVTTRGGNTGVVKVQTSDQSKASSLPSSPVFTIPPQFQTFLLSKSSAMATSQAQAPYSTTTTAKSLPIISPLSDRGASGKSTPQSPVKCVTCPSPSPVLETARTLNSRSPVPVVAACQNQTKAAPTLSSVDSLLSAPHQSIAGVPTTVRAVQGIPQATTLSISKSPIKRCPSSGIVPEQSAFQKVFLVTPTTNTPATTKVSTAAIPSAVPGSRVLFMSQSASVCSTVTIPRRSITSEPGVTATTSSLAAMNVKPTVVQAPASAMTGAFTKVHGINISGLTARVVDEAQPPEAAPKVMPMTTSNAQMFVHKSNPAATSCPQNVKGPVKVTESTDCKTITFSTYGIGHMASSALLSTGERKSLPSIISVPSILKKSEPLPDSLPSPSLGSLVRNTTLPRGLTTDNSWVTTSLITAPSTPPVVMSVPRFCRPQSLSTTTHTPSTSSPASQPGSSLAIRSPVSPLSGATMVQEKVVINTSAPLVPGTQLFINNMRFVVPAQGLGSGSHVLFFSTPAIRPAGQVGTSPVLPDPRAAGASHPLPATSVFQGPRMVAPGIQSQRTSACPAATTGTADAVHQKVPAPMVPSDSTAVAQVTQQPASGFQTGQQSLTNVVRLASFSAPEGKGHTVASSPGCPRGTLSVQLPKSSAMPVQTGLVRAPPQPQRTSVLAPVISRIPPMVTMPPMSRTVLRTHTLPVATVPPIGGTFSNSQGTPIATVPPSVNTVSVTPCQPVRSEQPGVVRMPAVLTDPSQGKRKFLVQAATSKLLLSPDGAILNVVRSPTLNVPAMANPTTAQVAVPTCGAVTLNTLDSQTILTEGPNH